MDFNNDFRDIISASIKMVENSNDPEVVRNVLQKTHDLLLCLDGGKNLDYKLALIMEYLEGMAPILPNKNSLQCYDFVKGLRDKKQQAQVHTQITRTILDLADPTLLNPPLVVFWLQHSCDLRDLKNMHALMLFLTKDEQKQIFRMDKSFLQNPKFKLLRECLPKHS